MPNSWPRCCVSLAFRRSPESIREPWPATSIEGQSARYRHRTGSYRRGGSAGAGPQGAPLGGPGFRGPGLAGGRARRRRCLRGRPARGHHRLRPQDQHHEEPAAPRGTGSGPAAHSHGRRRACARGGRRRLLAWPRRPRPTGRPRCTGPRGHRRWAPAPRHLPGPPDHRSRVRSRDATVAVRPPRREPPRAGLETGLVQVTAQNHEVTVIAETLPAASGFVVSQIDLNDGSVEGCAT